jgi:hypothetical protein
MYSSNFRKYLTATVAGFGVFSFGSLVMPNTANAFSVGYGNTFDNGFADWNTSGDTDIQGTLTGTYNGTAQSYRATGTGNQAVLTTACSSTAYTPNSNLSYQNTECFDTQDDTQPRNDDSNADAGTFNYSGNDQTDANAENSASTFPANQITNVQEFLGLSANALNIPLQDGETNLGDERTPKEGSAIKLNDTIVADGPFTISFNWTYLTNDGQDEFLGDSDYAFVTIYDENSAISSRSPIVLADSDAFEIPSISSSDTAYALEKNGTYTSSVLPGGNYVVGFGVVDIEGVNRSSALLIDDFQTSAAVPFEFSPTTGIGLVAGFIGLARLRRRFQ